MFVESAQPMEIVIMLSIASDIGQQKNDTIGIGFSIYDMKGKKIMNNRVPDPVLENNGGYIVGSLVTFDGKIKPNPTAGVPYTFIMTAFEKGNQAKFNVTIWYKKSQGNLRIEEF